MACWLVAGEEWAEAEKMTESRKRAKSKMAAVYDRIGSAGRFVVSLSPVKVNLVDY